MGRMPQERSRSFGGTRSRGLRPPSSGCRRLERTLNGGDVA